MYDAVLLLCNQRYEIITSLPALQIAFDDFVTQLSALRQIQAQAFTSTKGTTELKKYTRITAQNEALTFAAALTALASNNKLPDLYANANISLRSLSNLSSKKFLITIKGIFVMASKHLDDLGPYNLDAQSLGSFNEAIEAYHENVMAPKTAIGMSVAAKITFKNAIDAIDALLNNRLDKTLNLLHSTHPEFVMGYRATRRIVNNPTKTKKVKAKNKPKAV